MLNDTDSRPLLAGLGGQTPDGGAANCRCARLTGHSGHPRCGALCERSRQGWPFAMRDEGTPDKRNAAHLAGVAAQAEAGKMPALRGNVPLDGCWLKECFTMPASLPGPLLFSRSMCLLFWQAVWAQPMRAALGATFVDALVIDLPDWPVLRRLGPLCIQRVIAQAVITRYAWMRRTGIPVLPRYEEDSEICWDDLVTQPAERQCLQEEDEWGLSRLFGLYLDWLMQLIDLPAEAVPPWRRLVALVGICGRFAQIYAEWRRRVGAVQARAKLREDLRHYLGPQAHVA